VPRKSLQLNDFSGGLNTKSSPRDIAPNEVSKANNVNLHNPGLILSSSVSSDKSSANAPNAQTTAGYGAFMFNSQYNTDSSGTLGTAVQVFAFPENNTSGTSTKILTYARNFGNTSTLTLTEDSNDAIIDMKTENGVLPVYYFVDGTLFVSDENVVDEVSGSHEEPRRLVYVNKTDRFGSDVSGWLDTTMQVEKLSTKFETITKGTSFTDPGVGEFSIKLQTDPTLDSQSFFDIIENNDADNFLKVTPNPNETNPDPTADIKLTDKLIHLKLTDANDMSSVSLNYGGSSGISTGGIANLVGEIIHINGEAMRVRSTNTMNGSSTLDVLQLLVDRDVFGTGALEHATGAKAQTTSETSISVTGGGWEAGSYEFCHTIVDLQDNETLPQTPKTTLFPITTGAYFTNVGFRIKDTGFSALNTGYKNEKGVRVYTRKKDGNGRWILFLDVDYERGIRTNLFEDFNAFTHPSDTDFADVTGLDVVNPSLDTYESINGYSQDEESIDVGTRGATGTSGGFKAATVCSRRAWIANVKKNGEVFDDRIYYSPVNRFATFPDSYYLDIGISDGDSFTALHSLGNRLLAFKQKKLYVINVSSTSDAGWYLEAEYDGMGCIFQNAVSKTPFGICWVNRNGVYIFDGSSAPKELTAKLDDNLWQAGQELSSALLKPSIAYEPKYKQLYVLQDSAMTSNSGVDTEDKVFCYDFATQGWTTRACVGSADVSNFVESFDGIYFFKHSDNKIHSVTNDQGAEIIGLKTKDLDFGNPGLVKKVKRVFITCRDNGEDTDLALKYYNDGKSSSHTGSLAAQQINSADYKILEFTIANSDRDCESMAFELISSDGGGTSGSKIDINDINIDYRQTNKRPS
tara:strand:+ start:200 stop:2779 length:2580 start_codon:yes stop_codon:yes gene_type:complete